MGYTVTYNKIWKWVMIDWSTMQTFYWEDFNPSPFDRPVSFTTVTAKNVTTSFDLVNFQHWHEVWCGVIQLDFDADYEGYLWGDFERYDGSRSYDWYTWWDVGPGWSFGAYIYFWVDDDEVRPWYTKYRIHYNSVDWVIDFYSPEFTVSNLSFDDSLHRAWFMRVEWSHLCYTDGTHWTRWYKHIIAYDGSYSTSVWSDNKWYIWLDSWDNTRIYYVDKNWYRRRTYSSNAWYGWNTNVWSGNRWYMRVSDWDDSSDWYGHLCFVAPNWSKRRILNWPTVWYT